MNHSDSYSPLATSSPCKNEPSGSLESVQILVKNSGLSWRNQRRQLWNKKQRLKTSNENHQKFTSKTKQRTNKHKYYRCHASHNDHSTKSPSAGTVQSRREQFSNKKDSGNVDKIPNKTITLGDVHNNSIDQHTNVNFVSENKNATLDNNEDHNENGTSKDAITDTSTHHPHDVVDDVQHLPHVLSDTNSPIDGNN